MEPWVKDLVNIAQAGVLSVAFLYFCWKVPSMYSKYLDNMEKLKVLDNENRQNERAFLAEQLKIERDVCERRHQENLTEWRLERDRREQFQGELRQHHQLRADEAKELRHAIKGLAQSVVVSNAIAQQVHKVQVPTSVTEERCE